MKNAVCERWSKLDDDVHKVFMAFKEKVKSYEYATVIYVKIEEWKKIGCSYLASLIDETTKESPPPIL